MQACESSHCERNDRHSGRRHKRNNRMRTAIFSLYIDCTTILSVPALVSLWMRTDKCKLSQSHCGL